MSSSSSRCSSGPSGRVVRPSAGLYRPCCSLSACCGLLLPGYAACLPHNRRRSVPRGPVAAQPSRPSSGEKGGQTAQMAGCRSISNWLTKTAAPMRIWPKRARCPRPQPGPYGDPVPQYTCTGYAVQPVPRHSTQCCTQRHWGIPTGPTLRSHHSRTPTTATS